MVGGVSGPLAMGVDFVFVETRDFARAERFYVALLGMRCAARYREEGGEFETDGFTLSMLESSFLGREFQPSRSAIAIHVDDVAAARAELEAKGVEFDGDILDSGVCHQAFFTDPDGNALILHHRYAPKSS